MHVLQEPSFLAFMLWFVGIVCRRIIWSRQQLPRSLVCFAAHGGPDYGRLFSSYMSMYVIVMYSQFVKKI